MRLDVKNLNFSYADKTIIKNLSFSVPDGAFISILGPSGCGKSTLLNVLSGLLKPQSGEIRIDDVPVRGTSRELAYMPQNDLLFQWRTILDNVCLYGEIHHQKKEMRQTALRQMARFGLAGCENKYPDELSGGMRQRAAFLRTTLCEAGIYLLDEPLNGIDLLARDEIMKSILEAVDPDVTLVVSSHLVDELERVADAAIFMKEGHLIRQCMVEELRISQHKSVVDLYREIYGHGGEAVC